MKKCKLIIRDEVNVKIEGLELPDRRALVNKFKYSVPGAKYLPAVRLGRWDGKVAFYQLGGSTYINLLSEILPILDSAGYEIELDDQRDYKFDYKFDPIDENTFSHINWPKGHPVEGQPIIFRDYQVDAVNGYLENRQSVQSLATGSGKTLMCAAMSQRCEQYGRTLIIVPNRDLVKQTEEDYVNLGLDVGVYFGGRKEYGKTHTIATWQSLNSMLKQSKDNEAEVDITDFIEGMVCIIVDECFARGTPILTPNGTVPIETLKPGDIIINLDEQTNTYKEDVVVKLHKNLTVSESEEMLELEFETGEVLQVTSNHKFLTNQGWVRADELTCEMEVIDVNTYR